MDLQKLSGENLAEVLNVEYQRLMQAQNNILIIQKELERRKQKLVEPKPEEQK